MALPRPSCLRGAAGRSTFRKAGSQARSKPFRDVGRRFYASGHETKKSSDLPWAIGSIVVTVPAATWLLGQAPKKSDHGHHGDHGEEDHEKADEEPKEEEPKEEDEPKDDEKEAPSDEDKSKDDGEEKAAEPEAKEETKGEDEKSDDSGSEDESKDTPQTSDDEQGYEPPGPNAPAQINKNPRKGPGETQKGERKPTEKKGEKDAAKNHSGAKNPRSDEPGRSRKAEGVLDTAKIHGTVDPRTRRDGPPKDSE